MTPRTIYIEVVRGGLGRLASFMPWSSRDTLSNDSLTTKLQNGEIPTPSDATSLVGDDELTQKSFYLSLALLHDIIRREGRDPYFVHPYSVAVKPDYRFNDNTIPSGFRTTIYEKRLGLTHDLEEEVGRTPIGAHVVGDIVEQLLGHNLAVGLDYLTNTNDIAMDTIKPYTKRLDPEVYKRLGARDISSMLHKAMESVRIGEVAVRNEYMRIAGILKNFVDDVNKFHTELADADRDYIVEHMNDWFVQPLEARIRRGDLISPRALKTEIQAEFGHVTGIVDAGSYVEADPRLILRSESPFLVTLDKTLYQDFLNRMMEHAFNQAVQQRDRGQLKDDSALSIPIIKASDIAATVATMEDAVDHAISQFRKARRNGGSGYGLIERLNHASFGSNYYQRYANALDFARRILLSVLSDKPKILKRKRLRDDVYERQNSLYEIMLEKIHQDDGSGKGNGNRKSASVNV